MKQLYYNPMETPAKIHIKSSCFNIDVEYAAWEAGERPVYIDDLFALVKSRVFESVEVYLTSHNDAYIKDSKKAIMGTPITGWVSLSNIGNGGGYLDDKYCWKLQGAEK